MPHNSSQLWGGTSTPLSLAQEERDLVRVFGALHARQIVGVIQSHLGSDPAAASDVLQDFRIAVWRVTRRDWDDPALPQCVLEHDRGGRSIQFWLVTVRNLCTRWNDRAVEERTVPEMANLVTYLRQANRGHVSAQGTVCLDALNSHIGMIVHRALTGKRPYHRIAHASIAGRLGLQITGSDHFESLHAPGFPGGEPGWRDFRHPAPGDDELLSGLDPEIARSLRVSTRPDPKYAIWNSRPMFYKEISRELAGQNDEIERLLLLVLARWLVQGIVKGEKLRIRHRNVAFVEGLANPAFERSTESDTDTETDERLLRLSVTYLRPLLKEIEDTRQNIRNIRDLLCVLFVAARMGNWETALDMTTFLKHLSADYPDFSRFETPYTDEDLFDIAHSGAVLLTFPNMVRDLKDPGSYNPRQRVRWVQQHRNLLIDQLVNRVCTRVPTADPRAVKHAAKWLIRPGVGRYR